MLNKIIAKTVGLQTEYVYKMAEQFDSGKISSTEEHQLKSELNRKSQITLGNQAIDDLKVFFASLAIFIRQMYCVQLDNDDYTAIQEDLAKIVLNMILQGDVLKVLICLVRIDCFDQDKDLRAKYSLLKGIQSCELGIDPYLSLSDASTFFRELTKKYGLSEIEGGSSHREVSMLINTTL